MTIIFVGPYGLPDELKGNSRIKFVKSLASPTTCSQIGVSVATSEWIMCSCDDAVMEPGAQDVVWKTLKKASRKTVVLGKYTEGKRKHWKSQTSDNYYKVHGSGCTASPYIPGNWIIANFAYVNRAYFMELGGLDCRFKSPALPTTDFAVRAQRDGAKFVLLNTVVFRLSFDGAMGGTHGPIFKAFMKNDLPLYRSIYENPNCVERVRIDFDNWKSAPAIWRRKWRKQNPT